MVRGESKRSRRLHLSPLFRYTHSGVCQPQPTPAETTVHEAIYLTMANSQPNFRVVVRLPYNRPEESRPDPPRVEWNSEKEQILWEVIAKSRVVEGAGTDWKGLASHLQVPLPYLLYRAQARYEEDLRGLQGFRLPPINSSVPYESSWT
ncbi:hypothetical protein BC629DRAFT_492842 [Irpex lacteus]|nr:hypothetical protein BC629DRAFT_492842 [Irpex lacteus]